MKIQQIVPALPPRQEGIGGYAMALARNLRQRGVETIFACPHAASVDFEVVGLESIADELPTLLHYANYGYHPRGTPAAIVERLSQRGSPRGEPRLAVFFHEFVATGPPWRRSFWSAHTQRMLTRRLAQAAAAGLTTIPVYAELLNHLAPQLTIRRLAMPSPVGEPRVAPAVRDRSPQAIVFGGPGNRAAVYRALTEIGSLLAPAGVATFVDVGPDTTLAPSVIAGTPVSVRGEMPGADLSDLLLDARLGFAAYPADFLGKSTAFAALAAHGVPCLALRAPKIGAVEAPCLLPGDLSNPTRLDSVGEAVRAWYGGHDLATHADATLLALGLAR